MNVLFYIVTQNRWMSLALPIYIDTSESNYFIRLPAFLITRNRRALWHRYIMLFANMSEKMSFQPIFSNIYVTITFQYSVQDNRFSFISFFPRKADSFTVIINFRKFIGLLSNTPTFTFNILSQTEIFAFGKSRGVEKRAPLKYNNCKYRDTTVILIS